MAIHISDQTLQAYLDESLAPEHMAAIEQRLRSDPDLIKRLAELTGQRDAGVHSLGEIWRRHRLSCPSRQQLGSYLLGALMPEERDYIEFHIRVVGCRYCQSNLTDLMNAQKEAVPQVTQRRQKYFQSSVGILKNKRK
jgi:hypothetical protein